MLFNSLAFLIFFPVVTAGYFLLPHSYRKWWLLGASCFFYMSFVPIYIVILAFTIGVDYVAGIWIEKSEGRKRRWVLIASIVSNLGVLAFFKYFNFLNESIAVAVRSAGFDYGVPDLGILLPIGLSFHTFQSLSYTIEVYRRHQVAERRLGVFALYVMFYPQLVAGPIERPENLLRQIPMPQQFEADRVLQGLRQMLWGFFKKLVIADRCAAVVNLVYQDPGSHDGWTLLLATYLFAMQIYCDFSGYTDIALGAARIMGFRLMVNFRTPYRSSSIKEFWARWHISLSSWFRDYLYIPLGGNRVVKGRWYFNLFLVFLLSGLWHGANWTYVIWGGLHGGYLVLAIVCAPLLTRFTRISRLDVRPRLQRALNVLVTFHLAVFAWLFFRANSLADAMKVLGTWTGQRHGGLGMQELSTSVGPAVLGLTVVLCILFLWIDPRCDAVGKGELPIKSPSIDLTYHALLLVSCLLLGNYGDSMFIYFQF